MVNCQSYAKKCFSIQNRIYLTFIKKQYKAFQSYKTESKISFPAYVSRKNTKIQYIANAS